MAKYLYIFCYQTPEQTAKCRGEAFGEEMCEAVFIEADSSEQALEWGRQVSDRFVQQHYGDAAAKWSEQAFAHWIELEPENEYPLDVLQRVPAIAYGVYPNL